MNTIDIRDIIANKDNEPEEYALWKEAIEQNGLDMESIARNSAYFISEDDFEEYAQEEAEEIHGIRVNQWPFTYIDWPEAAIALQGDYSNIEVDGTTYYFKTF